MDVSVLIGGLLTGGLYAIVGLGLSLVFGVMRLVNLAHGEIIVVGAYASGLVVAALGVDPFLSLVVVVPLMAAAAYPVQRYLLTGLLRRGIEPPLVATFGISLVLSAGLTQLFGGNARSLPSPYASVGLEVLGVSVRLIDVVGVAIGVALMTATFLVMRRTRWGAALRASAADPDTAGTVGINVGVVYAVTFAAAAAIAAVGGVFIGVAFSFTPTSGTTWILIGFTVVVLGGTGSALGTLVAGLVLGVLQAVGVALFGGRYRDFIVYAVFLVLLAVTPGVHRVRAAIRDRRRAPAARERSRS